jgi:diguanylate cyclase (GGDEF)-like protein/PAS domain S-box-containing protein
MVETLQGGTYVTSAEPEERILYVSGWAPETLGIHPDEWLANPRVVIERMHPEDRERVLSELAAARAGTRSCRCEYRVVAQAGSVMWLEHQIRPVYVAGADPLWMETLRDITLRKQVEHELRSLVYLDELTGLYNRRAFFKLAAQQLQLAHRTGRGGVLLYVDIDSLRSVNEESGRAAGDAALVEVASLLRKTFRDSDLLARHGDDEFSVWAIETDGDQGDLLRGRLLANLDEMNALSRETPLRISVGWAFCRPGEQTSVPALLTIADAEMYSQKRKQGGR